MHIPKEIESFLDFLKTIRRASPHTVKSYRFDLRHLSEFSGKYGIEDFSFRDARLWVSYLYNLKLQPRSIARCLSSARSFFQFLVTRRLAKDNPFKLLQSPKLPGRLPSFLDEKEFNKLASQQTGDEFHLFRNTTILELFYGCGLRCSELAGLDLNDVGIGDRFIRVLGKGSKFRNVPLPRYTSQIMNRYLEKRHSQLLDARKESDAVFINRRGGRISDSYIRKFVRRYAMLAGIQKKVSPHTIRHTFATHMLGAGADIRTVQELLGHSNPETTAIYTHVTVGKLKEVYKKFHPRA